MVQLEKLSNLMNRCFTWVGGAAFIVMIGIACANMLLRPFGTPLKGAYELVGFFGALTVALALGYTQISRGHLAVDVLAMRYPKRARRIIGTVNSLLCTIFFGLVAWQVAVLANTISKRGETSETLRIAFHPFIYIVAISCAFLAFVLLVDFLRSLAPEKGTRR